MKRLLSKPHYILFLALCIVLFEYYYIFQTALLNDHALDLIQEYWRYKSTNHYRFQDHHPLMFYFFFNLFDLCNATPAAAINLYKLVTMCSFLLSLVIYCEFCHSRLKAKFTLLLLFTSTYFLITPIFFHLLADYEDNLLYFPFLTIYFRFLLDDLKLSSTRNHLHLWNIIALAFSLSIAIFINTLNVFFLFVTLTLLVFKIFCNNWHLEVARLLLFIMAFTALGALIWIGMIQSNEVLPSEYRNNLAAHPFLAYTIKALHLPVGMNNDNIVERFSIAHLYRIYLGIKYSAHNAFRGIVILSIYLFNLILFFRHQLHTERKNAIFLGAIIAMILFLTFYFEPSAEERWDYFFLFSGLIFISSYAKLPPSTQKIFRYSSAVLLVLSLDIAIHRLQITNREYAQSPISQLALEQKINGRPLLIPLKFSPHNLYLKTRYPKSSDKIFYYQNHGANYYLYQLPAEENMPLILVKRFICILPGCEKALEAILQYDNLIHIKIPR